MRRFNNLERDRTQNRIPLLLIALVKPHPGAKPLTVGCLGEAFPTVLNEKTSRPQCQKIVSWVDLVTSGCRLSLPPRSGGEGSRVGGGAANTAVGEFADRPPTPTPQSELRSSRPRHALTRAEGGEKKTSSIFKQHIPSLRAKRSNPCGNKHSVDCVVAFAPRNDVEIQFRIPATQSARVLPVTSRPLQRAQGMPGAWCARSRACGGSKHAR